jgi:hypothetical protein
VKERRHIAKESTRFVGFFGGINKFVFEDIKNKVDNGEKIDPEFIFFIDFFNIYINYAFTISSLP